MRRTPIVLGGTVAGLAGVLTFHTRPGPSGFPAASSGAAAPGAAAAPARSRPSRTASGAGAGASPQPASTASKGAWSAAADRTAVGPQVNYSFGIVSVKVTVARNNIVKFGVASLDDGGNPRSQFIDQQAIPMFEEQALQAQSANIQGVSGASHTSEGFVQSLQSALRKLGLT